jgi:MFS family permease
VRGVSFRSFIYDCTAWGGAASGVGWLLGLPLEAEPGSSEAALQGLLLGACLGFVLGVADASMSHTRLPLGRILPRGLLALGAGAVGGFLGGLLARSAELLPVGWALAGLLIGAGAGAFDFLAAAVQARNARGGLRKLCNGLVGGALGGLAGGLLFLVVMVISGSGLLEDDPWLVGALSCAALGAGIGLGIALVQVFFRGAWLRVESGFRPGRQLVLCRPETTLGRAESCDLGLFSDPSVEMVHARIVRRGADYLLADAAPHTFVNDSPVTEPITLRSGDLIRIGQSTCLFLQKRRS